MTKCLSSTLPKPRTVRGWCITLSPLLGTLLGSLLQGCNQQSCQLSTRYQSANQNERIAFLILHYTDEDDAHYLIPRYSRKTPLPVYRLMPNSQRAWHAGRSRWHQYAGLNASSLCIEIVNLGYPPEDEQRPPDWPVR